MLYKGQPIWSLESVVRNRNGQQAEAVQIVSPTALLI